MVTTLVDDISSSILKQLVLDALSALASEPRILERLLGWDSLNDDKTPCPLDELIPAILNSKDSRILAAARPFLEKIKMYRAVATFQSLVSAKDINLEDDISGHLETITSLLQDPETSDNVPTYRYMSSRGFLASLTIWFTTSRTSRLAAALTCLLAICSQPDGSIFLYQSSGSILPLWIALFAEDVDIEGNVTHKWADDEEIRQTPGIVELSLNKTMEPHTVVISLLHQLAAVGLIDALMYITSLVSSEASQCAVVEILETITARFLSYHLGCQSIIQAILNLNAIPCLLQLNLSPSTLETQPQVDQFISAIVVAVLSWDHIGPWLTSDLCKVLCKFTGDDIALKSHLGPLSRFDELGLKGVLKIIESLRNSAGSESKGDHAELKVQTAPRILSRTPVKMDRTAVESHSPSRRQENQRSDKEKVARSSNRTDAQHRRPWSAHTENHSLRSSNRGESSPRRDWRDGPYPGRSGASAIVMGYQQTYAMDSNGYARGQRQSMNVSQRAGGSADIRYGFFGNNLNPSARQPGPFHGQNGAPRTAGHPPGHVGTSGGNNAFGGGGGSRESHREQGYPADAYTYRQGNEGDARRGRR